MLQMSGTDTGSVPPRRQVPEVRDQALYAFHQLTPPGWTLLDVDALPLNQWGDDPEVCRMTDGLNACYYGFQHGRSVPVSKRDIRLREGGPELLKEWETR